MNHPEILLVPAFMFADYFLTLAGAIQRGRKYEEHFKIEHYEMNPVWQKAVKERRWINPRHILLTAALTVLLVLLAESTPAPDPLIPGLLGALLVLFGMVIGRHISNLMIFTYMSRNPEGITGQVTMTHGMTLAIAFFANFILLPPLILIALFAPHPFTIGGLCGAVMLIAIHLGWMWRHKRRAVKAVSGP